MPAPMMAPMPRSVRFHAPSARRSECSPSEVASSWSSVMLLVVHSPMRLSPVGAHTKRGGADVPPECIQALNFDGCYWTVKEGGCRCPCHLSRVVRRLSRDRHVVGMRLAQSRHRNPDELRSRPQIVDGGRPHIAHTAAKTADHLIEHVRHGAFIRDAPLDTLGYELPGRELPFLEVAVRAAILHGAERSHSPNHLVAASF